MSRPEVPLTRADAATPLWLLGHPDDRVRADVLAALARLPLGPDLRDDAVIAVLAELDRTASPYWPDVAWSAALLADQQADTRLLGYARDPSGSDGTSGAAAVALAQVQHPAARGLLPLLRDRYPDVPTVRALGRYLPETGAHVDALLGADRKAVRVAAALALAEAGDEAPLRLVLPPSAPDPGDPGLSRQDVTDLQESYAPVSDQLARLATLRGSDEPGPEQVARLLASLVPVVPPPVPAGAAAPPVEPLVDRVLGSTDSRWSEWRGLLTEALRADRGVRLAPALLFALYGRAGLAPGAPMARTVAGVAGRLPAPELLRGLPTEVAENRPAEIARFLRQVAFAAGRIYPVSPVTAPEAEPADGEQVAGRPPASPVGPPPDRPGGPPPPRPTGSPPGVPPRRDADDEEYPFPQQPVPAPPASPAPPAPPAPPAQTGPPPSSGRPHPPGPAPDARPRDVGEAPGRGGGSPLDWALERLRPGRGTDPDEDAGAALPPPADPQRVVSTGFAEPDAPYRPRAAHQALRPDHHYLYWFEIGPPVPGAIDVAPAAAPLAGLPAGTELDVVLFPLSGGVTVAPETARGRLVLDADGTVRLPGATAGDPAGRRLFFGVRTPDSTGTVRLRCNLYHRRTLLQSHVTTADVRRLPGGRRGRPALSTEVDYSVTRTLDPGLVRALPEHALSILVNDDGDGGHGFYFEGRAGYNRVTRIGAADLDRLLRNARDALRRASWGSDAEWTPAARYRYGDVDPELRARHLAADLRDLARSGTRLWYSLVPALAGSVDAADPRAADEQLRELMRAPGRIQLVSRQDLRLVVPVSLVYDYPYQPGGREPRLCPSGMAALAAGDADRVAADPCFTGQCPRYGDLDVVCPGGFWGFRHEVGLPWSQELAGPPGLTEAASAIRFADRPTFTVGVSTDSTLIRRERHQKVLEALHVPVDWHLGDDVDSLLDLFARTEPHLVYLLCHGGVARDGTPFLEVGKRDEEYFDAAALRVRPIRWDRTRPLVVLNGCHTTALTPDLQLDFVRTFVQYCGAAGVIGTEITVFEDLACDFAEDVLKRLLAGGQPLGAAVRSARLALLARGNPLGLVYTPFASTGLRYTRT